MHTLITIAMDQNRLQLACLHVELRTVARDLKLPLYINTLHAQGCYKGPAGRKSH